MAKINKFANIYDTDGTLISHVNEETGVLDKYTIEDVEKLVDDLTKKVQENPENKHYKIRLNNAQSYLFHIYNTMSREELLNRLSVAKEIVENAKTERSEAEQKIIEQVNEEIDKLKEAYEQEEVEYEEISTKE